MRPRTLTLVVWSSACIAFGIPVVYAGEDRPAGVNEGGVPPLAPIPPFAQPAPAPPPAPGAPRAKTRASSTKSVPVKPFDPSSPVRVLPNSPIPPPPTEVIPPAAIPGPPAEFADRPTATPLTFEPVAVDGFEPWEQPIAKPAATSKSSSGKSVTQRTPAERWLRTGSCAGLGVGAVALAVGVWQGSQSRIAQIDFATARDQPGVFAAKQRGEVAAERANWWFIGGGTLLGISTAVLVWTW